jgi:Fe-S-cluster containining protein
MAQQIEVVGNLLTIDNSEDVPSIVNCIGCAAPCCSGPVAPVLSKKEVLSGKYPIKIVQVPKEVKHLHPGVVGLATLFVDPIKGCIWLKDGLCTHYDERPMACRAFDCRKDKAELFREFVKKRFDKNGNVKEQTKE